MVEVSERRIHMKSNSLYVVAAVLLAFTGCASLPVYDEPDEIPRSVSTYRDESLREIAKDIAVNLDFNDCVEAALLVSKGVFGGSDIEAELPVRQIVAREFGRMVTDNFHETAMDEQCDLKIKISTMRILITRKMNKVDADVSINVKLVHPDETRAPIFRKTYRSKTFCPSCEGVVPSCFYQAVQQVVADVVTDFVSDRNVYQYLKAKGQKENK